MRADAASILLHSAPMAKTPKDAQEIRRYNVALVRQTHDKKKLAETGLSPAQLYQMSTAKPGKHWRPVSDKHVTLLAKATGLDIEWFDEDHRAQKQADAALEIKAAQVRKLNSWPFTTVDRSRFDKLDGPDQLAVEVALLRALTKIEADNRPRKAKDRRPPPN